MTKLRIVVPALPALCLLFVSLQAVKSEETPEWINVVDSSEYIVASSDEFPSKLGVSESKAAVVRDALARWAEEKCGVSCAAIISEFPDEELKALIEADYFETILRQYGSDTKELSGQSDEYFRGHWRICVSDDLQEKIQAGMIRYQIRHRLGLTLVASVFGFGSCFVLWGYLFVAKLTRGFYVSRLRWVAGVTLLLLIAFCYWLSLVTF